MNRETYRNDNACIKIILNYCRQVFQNITNHVITYDLND